MIEPSILANADCLELLISQLSEFVVVIVSTDGKYTSWHPGVELQFGYKADEFIGQDVDLLFTPEDRTKSVPQQELKDAAESGPILRHALAGEEEWAANSRRRSNNRPAR